LKNKISQRLIYRTGYYNLYKSFPMVHMLAFMWSLFCVKAQYLRKPTVWKKSFP